MNVRSQYYSLDYVYILQQNDIPLGWQYFNILMISTFPWNINSTFQEDWHQLIFRDVSWKCRHSSPLGVDSCWKMMQGYHINELVRIPICKVYIGLTKPMENTYNYVLLYSLRYRSYIPCQSKWQLQSSPFCLLLWHNNISISQGFTAST